MNKENNQRRKASRQKLENAFIELIQTRELNDISITDLCKTAHLNRSTFYANYIDIFDLVEKIKDRMMYDFQDLYASELEQNYNSNNFLKLFRHIKENQLFYKTYFKLNFDMDIKITRYDTHLAQKYYANKHIEYHAEFFRGGITSIIKMWLDTNCQLPPEALFEIIQSEYQTKH